MNEDKINEEGERLNVAKLSSVKGCAALGLATAKHLLEHRVCTVYLDSEGNVQIAMPGEVTLDAIPEPMAIQELTNRGYDDSDLASYLKGRDERMGRG